MKAEKREEKHIFSIATTCCGPEKTAFMVCHGGRLQVFGLPLQGSAVPVVPEYRYLGVVFQASRKWKLQIDSLLARSTRKFH